MQKHGAGAVRMSITKKLSVIFVAFALLLWLALRLLQSPIAAAAVTVVLAAAFYFIVYKTMAEPLQKLTLAVIESRPTQEGFEFKDAEIHTKDEIELLADAFQRMAHDINEQNARKR